MRAHPPGRELDRESDPVKATADLRDRSCVGVVDGKPVATRRSALHEELDGGRAQGSGGAKILVVLRELERREKVHVLSVDSQGLAARCEEVHLIRILEDVLGQGRDGVDDMLAIV